MRSTCSRPSAPRWFTWRWSSTNTAISKASSRPGDILEAITGAFQEEEGDESAFVTREDGSFLVSGWMQVDEFQDKIGVPIPKDAKYETVAGYVLAELNHLPNVGETFERGHWHFEVVDLDGRRIDKVLVTRKS